jgi:hypothetical protein
MKTDDLERCLEAMFASEAARLEVPEREWSGLAEMRSSGPGRRRLPTFLVPTLAGTAVLALLAAGLVVTTTREERREMGSSSPGTTLPPTGPRRAIATKQVSMEVRTLTIDIDDGGVRTTFSNPDGAPDGDPGTMNEYTTLEMSWREHDVEMRLNVYFTSDGTDWWANEIRTYDGRAQGKWITYDGEFFRSKLGTPFIGNLDVRATDHGVTGRLRLTDLVLEVFPGPDPCLTPPSPLALKTTTGRVSLAPGQSASVAVELLDAAANRAVPAGDLEHRWTVDHPAIATVVATGHRATITGLSLGITLVHAEPVRGRSIGGASIVVEVNSWGNPAATAAGEPPAGTPVITLRASCPR